MVMDVRKEVEALIAAPSCCKEAKEAGEKYCTCPARQAGGMILDRANEL